MVGLEKIKHAKKVVIGAKQTKKAIESNKAETVFVARDAENRGTDPIYKLCKEKGIEIIEVASMRELGRACGIEVGSASAAIIQ